MGNDGNKYMILFSLFACKYGFVFICYYCDIGTYQLIYFDSSNKDMTNITYNRRKKKNRTKI